MINIENDIQFLKQYFKDVFNVNLRDSNISIFNDELPTSNTSKVYYFGDTISRQIFVSDSDWNTIQTVAGANAFTLYDLSGSSIFTLTRKVTSSVWNTAINEMAAFVNADYKDIVISCANGPSMVLYGYKIVID